MSKSNDYMRIALNIFNWEYIFTAETEPSLNIFPKTEAGSLYLYGKRSSGGYPLRYLRLISEMHPPEYSIEKIEFLSADELHSIDEWLNNPEEKSRVVEFSTTALRYHKALDVEKLDKSVFKLKACFTDYKDWLEISSRASLKQQKIFSELKNITKYETSIMSQLKIIPFKIANIWVTTCTSYGDISLSKYHREIILDAINTFPNCHLKIEFEGQWTDISHKSSYVPSKIEINATAMLKPDKIDITVVSGAISN